MPCRDYLDTDLSRRRLLSIGGMGLLGLNLPRCLAAEERQPAVAPRAKSVIFLYQFGGPSHVDMLDMKPNAPEQIRGPHKPIASNVPGIEVSERLPRVAQVMDKVTLIRSMHHGMKNHNSASYYALTGHAPPTDDIRLRDSLDLFPAYGSVVDRLAPAADGMPTFAAYPYVIRDGAVTPGQHASFLGKKHDPLLVTEDPNADDFRLPELSLPGNLSLGRLEDRRELQKLIDRQARLLETSPAARGLDAYYDKALSMLNSPRVARAFDLSAEAAKLRDDYGRHSYGQSCLLARRLVEAGVRFVNVYFSDTIGGQSTTRGGWDTHGFNNTRMFPIVEKFHLPITDQTLPTLLNDLDDRGLLDTTLVVWMGEFGRTPKINDNVSRDHWPQCYTVLLAGGGVKRGSVYGASDKNASFPDRDPVRPDDLAATMFQLLGIDPQTEVFDTANRPLVIAGGNPISGILA
ncbi:MAG TPA: DUF1501 domain-containing protein [Pirellulales bacterium]|jgi:hypothetical protein|nr:DUF1501 domain-containing protein [Pirellulales bacterium]